MDKVTLKLLKELYKSDFLTFQESRALTGAVDERCLDERSEFLLRESLIRHKVAGVDDMGYQICSGYEITLAGRAYIEESNRRFWGFFLPYAITTLIAVLSLISTFVRQ